MTHKMPKQGGFHLKKHGLPEELEPSCELCEHFLRMEATGETFCNYKNRLSRVEESGFCRKFSFNIFACKPLAPILPKAFDFTKI